LKREIGVLFFFTKPIPMSAILKRNSIAIFHTLIFYCFNFFIIIIPLTSKAQCSSTGQTNGSVFTTDNSMGVYDFNNPSYSQSSDNLRSDASAVVGILTNNTYYLKVTGFNFNIPLNSTICGVAVETQRRATGLILTAAVRDNEVKLIKSGTITGQNKGNTSENWTNSDTYKAYGSSSDLWGTSLSPSDINSSDFGVAVSAKLIALVTALPSAEINNVRVTVYYDIILPVTLQYFKTNLTSNKVNLEWKMDFYDEKTVTVQRSSDNLTWNNIATFQIEGIATNNIFHYSDELQERGKYYYRLKFTSITNTQYSAIKSVNFEPGSEMKIYPVPSYSFVFVNGVTKESSITVTDFFQRKIRMPVEYLGNNICKLNIETLPRGIYFVQTGNSIQRFVKK
jgi:hypothetical protein